MSKNRTEIKLQALSQKAFTLVEMLMVTVIIGIVASFAIPPLIRARVVSNESVIQKDLSTIAAAMEAYRSSQNPPAYPENLIDLGGGAIPYIDSAVAAGMQHGYTFSYAPNLARDAYSCSANPIQQGATGNRSFCIDYTGVLKEYSQAIKPAEGICPANATLVEAAPIEITPLPG